MIGPTDRAHRIQVDGASVVSCAITPSAGPRLFRKPATSVRNLVADVDDLRAPGCRSGTGGKRARGDGRAADRDRPARRLTAATRPHRDAAMIATLADAIEDPRSTQVRDLVGADLSEARLRSLALRHFGSPTRSCCAARASCARWRA
ncbi:hypothetical protein AB5I41_26280 [Sphingomonas sp. MMS24-JH45]